MLCPVMTFDMLRVMAALAGSGSKKSSKDELWGEDCAVAAQNLYSWLHFYVAHYNIHDAKSPWISGKKCLT